MNNKSIAASLLSVKKEDRINVAKKLVEKGVNWFHYDVMDNEFVPNSALKVEEIIEIIKNIPGHVSDAHLMVNEPFEYADLLLDHIDYITIHYEVFKNEQDRILEFVDKYKKFNGVGIAIKPSTTFEEIKHIIHEFDLILIMSVEPGFGGQVFIPETLKKIQKFKKYILENQLNTMIQVDGGINNITSIESFKSGADVNVCGSYLVNNIDNIIIDKLTKIK